LIRVAVYRHQVEACAEAGPALLAHAHSALGMTLAVWSICFSRDSSDRDNPDDA